jgi:hypothetical protein
MRVKTPKNIRVKSPKMKVSKAQKKRNDLTFAFRNSSHGFKQLSQKEVEASRCKAYDYLA